MDARDCDPQRQLARAKALYRYHRALERGDFVTAAALLREAQTDAVLERMIVELNEAMIAAEARRTAPEVSREPAAASASRPREGSGGAVKMYDLGAAAPHTGPGMSGSLRRIDQHERAGDEDYSARVAEVLTAAYSSLQSGATAISEPETFNLLYQVLQDPMSPRQRLQACYVSGLARCRAGEFGKALPCLDDAISLVHAHGSHGDLADLLYLRGGARRGVGQVAAAAADLRACLNLIHAMSDGASPDDVAFELAVLTQLADYEFLLAEHTEAEEHLAAARRLLPNAPNAQVTAAKIEWLQALIYRWRGQPELALRPAASATHIAGTLNDPVTTIQLHIVLADVCLDLAQRLMSTADSDALAEMARTHIDAAGILTVGLGEHFARHLVELTSVRYKRMRTQRAHQYASRVATIEKAAQFAKATDDIPLLAHAYTTLGDEYAAHGEVEQSLACYREVLRCLEGTQMPALGVWARRALHNALEMRE